MSVSIAAEVPASNFITMFLSIPCTKFSMFVDCIVAVGCVVVDLGFLILGFVARFVVLGIAVLRFVVLVLDFFVVDFILLGGAFCDCPFRVGTRLFGGTVLLGVVFLFAAARLRSWSFNFHFIRPLIVLK